MARDAFTTFIPISVESNERVRIITDFFDLIAAIAAHGKSNGLGGHKLSRYAGWWAFGHIDTGKGFDAGYRSWERSVSDNNLETLRTNISSAADATSHLFFAYLRSMSPEGKTDGILSLPRSLQQLLNSSAYPPGRGFISNDTMKVVMIVDVVSPTPYALLRRAKNFEYRDSDRALQEFSNYEDPISALTDECRRVLSAISSTNQSHVSNAKTSTSLSDPSWSRFEDIGFSNTIDESDELDTMFAAHKSTPALALGPSKHDYQDLARPTTPSWADFLSSGFADEAGNKSTPMLLPPDKILPPLNSAARGQSSQSHRRNLDMQPNLEPGELASITALDVDDAFWWVWISSLAGEEPTSRKAVFGRCAFIETQLSEGRWMVMEEQVKGAAPEPAAGAYIAEKKKSFFGFTTKRGRLTRRRSGIKKGPLGGDADSLDNPRTTLAPDQHAKIQQAAADLTRKKKAEEAATQRRNVKDQDVPASNRNSVFTLGPHIKEEVSPALQWARQYDKKEIRSRYLGDKLAGRGSRELLTLPENGVNRSTSTLSSTGRETKDLPAPPQETQKPVDVTPAPATETPNPPVTIVEPAPAPPETAASVAPEIPVEAVKAPLPDTAAEQSKRPPSSKKLRKSQDGGRISPETQKVSKLPGPPPVRPSGIRRLFGTKKKDPSTGAKAPDSPVETNPAIQAARRALEGKPALNTNGTSSPPLSPGHFQKMKSAKSPIAAVQTVQEPSPAQAPTSPRERSVPPEPEQEVEPTRTEDAHPAPPRTRRDEEYDQLSRVDTNEKEHADREFSTFDQGPLDDQPAFVPEDSPKKDNFAHDDGEPKFRANHQSTYSAMSVPAEESDQEDNELTKQASPSDRWAQIRKNAAERATRPSEEQTNRSRTETRTDDGETSGEESKS